MSVSLARKEGQPPETEFLKEKYLIYDWKYKTQCTGDLTIRLKKHTQKTKKPDSHQNHTSSKKPSPRDEKKGKEVRGL